MLKYPPDERCPNCGGLYALIGHRHLCRGTPPTNLVTLPVTVTESVTPPGAKTAIADIWPIDPRAERKVREQMKQASAALREAANRIEELEAEIKQLKRALADARVGKPMALPAAERMRRMRARRRASAEAAT
jgi:hypothetical protein